MAQRPFIRSRTRSVTPGDAVLHETTDVEDIGDLAADIVALIQQAAYDDMTWAEVDAALAYAGHAIKLNWAATGSVKPAPPPVALAAAGAGEDEPVGGHGRHHRGKPDPAEADQP